MSATQLQELLATLMQNIQCESCKQTATSVATVDCKLSFAIENLKAELRYENEKLAENLIARFESVNVEIREEFNAKLSSEIIVVSDKIENVSRDAENKTTTLNNTIKGTRECMNDRMKTCGPD
jgi:deoxyhypusine synthase